MGARSVLARMRRRYRYRVVVGVLVVSLPVTIVLAVVLTSKASSNLTAATERTGAQVALGVTSHLEDFLSDRRENLTVVALQASSRLDAPAVGALAAWVDKTSPDYSIIEVTDLNGHVRAASRSQGRFDPSSEPWFRTAVSGQSVVTSPVEVGGDVRWVVAVPVLDPSGRPAGVVVGNLVVGPLADLLNPSLSNTEVAAIDSNHHLVYESPMGKVDGPGLLAKGGLGTTVDNVAVTRALAGQNGSARFREGGLNRIGGYAHVVAPDWAIVVEQEASVALAPVRSGRNLAIVLVLVAAVLAVLFALVFARRTTRPVVTLARVVEAVADGDLTARVDPSGPDEVRGLGEAFNAMVAKLGLLIHEVRGASMEVNSAAGQLSASSEELAATTTQQSAAVTEASSTTEELARASTAIADTVDEVAVQSAETRDNLEQAKTDIEASSERTVALAQRVSEIDAILTLINEIADQTNLLALNAAIEAARAGEGGRGFAVVAEEVRRLAERSKTSAGDIGTIIEGINNETNATVMAMEKGAKQMQRGLALLEAVTEATAQVRLTTQQQRSATGQVVETMDQLTSASRQVSATAQQLAGASASLVDLAGNLERTATTAKSRY